MKEATRRPLTLTVTGAHGGAGTTSVVLGLASVLATRGERVLVVDMSPQADATRCLGLGVAAFHWTADDVLSSVKTSAGVGIASQAAVPAGSDWPNVWLIPSERLLAARERDTGRGGELRLRLALEGVSDYDVVLIDAPHWGEMQLNALAAAHRALVVTEARSRAIPGVRNLMASVREIRTYYNRELQLAGIVVNRFKSESRDCQFWLDELTEDDEGLVPLPGGLIPDREAVPQAAAAEMPLTAFGRSARDVQEILERIADRVWCPA